MSRSSLLRESIAMDRRPRPTVWSMAMTLMGVFFGVAPATRTDLPEPSEPTGKASGR